MVVSTVESRSVSSETLPSTCKIVESALEESALDKEEDILEILW